MTIVLNHTIVPASDRRASAAFFAGLLDLRVGADSGPFSPVQVNDDLTLDFAQRRSPSPAHFAFLVDDATFDLIMRHVHADGLDFGSSPELGWNREINRLAGGRGVYVRDPDGHSYEFFTRDPLAA